ncbi:MAG: sugar transferase [Chloroflexota bacterium]
MPETIPSQSTTPFTKKRKASTLRSFTYRVVRRSLDIISTFLGLVFLSPFFAFVALLIRRDTPGPTFYQGLRVGRHGRTFHILKFRTMYENAESYNGPRITAQSDPRITPFGRWLRDTKLNELPQLWNVLKGEMSLVGPRPEDPEIVHTWPEDIRREILSMRPGMTSPASLVYINEENLLNNDQVMDDYLEDILPSKLRLDRLYVRNRSVLLDLDIIFLTLTALLPNVRKHPLPEHLIFWGFLSRFLSRHLRWFLVDVIVSLLAVGMAGGIWRSAGPIHIGWGNAILIASGISVIFSLINALTGINRTDWSRARPSEALDLAVSTAAVTGVLIISDVLLHSPLPWGLLAVSGILAFLGFFAVRYRTRILTGIATRWLDVRGHKALFGERVLIVGAGQVGRFAIWLIRNTDLSRAFTIAGLVDDDPRKVGMRIDGCNVLGTTNDIPRLMKECDAGLLLYSISTITPERSSQILEICHSTDAHVIIIPDILEIVHSYFPSKRSPTETRDKLKADHKHKIPIAWVSKWLDELDSVATSGDLASLQQKLQGIRTDLKNIPHETTSKKR